MSDKYLIISPCRNEEKFMKATLDTGPADTTDVDGEEPKVSLSRRAYPLIKMLEASFADNCEVMWD